MFHPYGTKEYYNFQQICKFVVEVISDTFSRYDIFISEILSHRVDKEKWLFDDVNNNPYHMTDLVSVVMMS